MAHETSSDVAHETSSDVVHETSSDVVHETSSDVTHETSSDMTHEITAAGMNRNRGVPTGTPLLVIGNLTQYESEEYLLSVFDIYPVLHGLAVELPAAEVV